MDSVIPLTHPGLLHPWRRSRGSKLQKVAPGTQAGGGLMTKPQNSHLQGPLYIITPTPSFPLMRKQGPRGSRGHSHTHQHSPPQHSQPLPVSHPPAAPSSLTPPPGLLTSGSVPSVFHTLMQTQTGMQSMEDRAMSQPMP